MSVVELRVEGWRQHAPERIRGEPVVELVPPVDNAMVGVEKHTCVLSRLTRRIRRRRAGSVDDTTDAIRAVACIGFVSHCGSQLSQMLLCRDS